MLRLSRLRRRAAVATAYAAATRIASLDRRSTCESRAAHPTAPRLLRRPAPRAGAEPGLAAPPVILCRPSLEWTIIWQFGGRTCATYF
jgi:hypothetical protein